MQRSDVYKAIDTEREFQNKHAEADDGHIVAGLSLGDTISAIEYNIRKLQDTWYKERKPYPSSMAYARKIAALVVQIAEDVGMPERAKD